MTKRRILCAQEVADILGKKKRTVIAYLKKGILPGRKPGGRVWEIPASAVDEYIAGLNQYQRPKPKITRMKQKKSENAYTRITGRPEPDWAIKNRERYRREQMKNANK